MHPHTLRNPPDPPRQCPHFSEILILPSPKFPYTSCWKPPLRASNFSKFSGEDPTATVNWENHSMAGRGIFKSLILLPPPPPYWMLKIVCTGSQFSKCLWRPLPSTEKSTGPSNGQGISTFIAGVAEAIWPPSVHPQFKCEWHPECIPSWSKGILPLPWSGFGQQLPCEDDLLQQCKFRFVINVCLIRLFSTSSFG